MFMKTTRGFFFCPGMKSRTFKYNIVPFVALCAVLSTNESNVSQEKQSCLKLMIYQCLIFMISLIILTTKIHKIGIDPSLEQTLPLYLT